MANTGMSASHLLYRKPALKTKLVSEASFKPALLPETVCQTIFSLSQTLNISRNLSFIVYRNMKWRGSILKVDIKPRWVMMMMMMMMMITQRLLIYRLLLN